MYVQSIILMFWICLRRQLFQEIMTNNPFLLYQEEIIAYEPTPLVHPTSKLVTLINIFHNILLINFVVDWFQMPWLRSIWNRMMLLQVSNKLNKGTLQPAYYFSTIMLDPWPALHLSVIISSRFSLLCSESVWTFYLYLSTNPVHLHRKGWRKFQWVQKDESNARKESSPRMLQFYHDIVPPRKPIEHMTQRIDHIFVSPNCKAHQCQPFEWQRICG
jgi:hypothetical protein